MTAFESSKFCFPARVGGIKEEEKKKVWAADVKPVKKFQSKSWY